MIAGTNKSQGRATGLAAMQLAGLALAGCVDRRADWARFENRMRAQGLMRSDYAPADVPITREDLIRNFEKVAFHSEYSPHSGATPQETPVALRKLSAPLYWQLLGTDRRPVDHENMRRLMARVGALTSLDPQMARSDREQDETAMFVLFVGAEDRAAMLDGQLWPDLKAKNPFAAEWLRNDKWPCVGFGIVRDDGAEGDRQVELALIPSEMDGLMRRACIEEEVIQSLGLRNDGEEVRPSMFNDDEEFALSTRHDELLLQILHDPRLKAGMTAAEGMPIVRAIVAATNIFAGADPIRVAQAGTEATQ